MSLFIGALAFPEHPELVDEARIGTLAGSIVAAIAGFAMLRLGSGAAPSKDDEEQAAEIFGADQEGRRPRPGEPVSE